MAAVVESNLHLEGQVRQRTRELDASNVTALQATRAKSEFLANMSHELRTPLNAVIGYSEMLQEEAQDLDQNDFIPDLQRINSAGRHLLELVNGVLDLSRIEAGRMELYLETFDVPTMVQDTVALIHPLIEKNSNVLEVHIEDNAGTMRADITKVRQTLFNMLSNASKFTEQGSIKLHVVREVGPNSEHGGERVRFDVADTGIGMTAEQISRLFMPFSQADVSTSRHYGGTGLGLALSRHFCRMMGGEITVKSQLGQGSTFTVRLPAEVKEQKPEKGHSGESGAVSPSEDVSTVLVIDDDPAALDLTTRFLTREGFRVHAASGGEEGLRMARDLRPNAITLDVLMPGMDGWAVLAALKSDSSLADIPVIMLTIVDDHDLGYMLGASDYIIKPIEQDRLVSVLNKYRSNQAHWSVLVVDDDILTRQLLRHMLEKEGWLVSEAGNGNEALAFASQNQLDLILIDLIMPEMDGFELINELRASRELCRKTRRIFRR